MQFAPVPTGMESPMQGGMDPQIALLLAYLQRQNASTQQQQPKSSIMDTMIKMYAGKKAAETAGAGAASAATATAAPSLMAGVDLSAPVASGISGDTLLAGGGSAAMTPGLASTTAAPSMGGMFAGQGLSGMSGMGMAGTALGIAAPLIVGPMLAKAMVHHKPYRQFNAEEVMKKNSFGKQLTGFDKLDPTGQKAFIQKAKDSGIKMDLWGEADKQGNTVNNAGASFRDIRQAMQNDYRRNWIDDGSRAPDFRNMSTEDVLAQLNKSPVANSRTIDRVKQLQDFFTQNTQTPKPAMNLIPKYTNMRGG